MFLWQASLGDRGTNPRALESRERPSRWHPQERTITSHALARRLRSKRHDNAKEESPACPSYRRSSEPLNSLHRSRNIAESPADTVGEYALQAVMDLRLRTLRLTGPRNSASVLNRRRPWLRLNRWFATQGKQRRSFALIAPRILLQQARRIQATKHIVV